MFHHLPKLLGAWFSSLVLSIPLATQAQPAPAAAEVTKERAIINHLVRLGEAHYQDATAAAKDLQQAIYEFLANPSPNTHRRAKLAWRTSRIAYQQTEAFRFAHPEVDELEGRVNAWPLDESFIDYVAKPGDTSQRLAQPSIIAMTSLSLGAITLNLKHFDVATLRALHEFGGNESNVATGYHAIEFLLWGQDLSGTSYGAGQRAYTDFIISPCPVGHCERRRQYLLATADLLVLDLEEMLKLFRPTGAVSQRLSKTADQPALTSILEGLASLSYGELAGERMQLGLLLGDPEEEHDCFSDLTHLSHYYNVIGLHNVYFGSFTNLAGQTITGPSLAAYAATMNPQLASKLAASFKASHASARLLYDMAEHTGTAAPMSYDMMLMPENLAGRRIIQNLIDALKVTTTHLMALGTALGMKLEPEGSAALDRPQDVLTTAPAAAP